MLDSRRFFSQPVVPLLRELVLLAGAVVLASCTVTPQQDESISSTEYGVPASRKVVADGDPVPKGGGHYLVGDPYRVAGHIYVPRNYSKYSAVGLASWYGHGFHGRRTANGEVYDVADLTAAHPTLPLPSYARVTNLTNGRSVVVRINDRGPFKRDRLIDVSASVAELLGFERAGTTEVKVDYVGPARMDGLDRKMLLASYRGPKAGGADDTLFAEKAAGKPAVILASATPTPMPKPRAGGSGDSDALVRLTPASSEVEVAQAIAPTGKEARIGNPFMLRTSLASSYAPDSDLSDAEAAAARLAKAGRRPVAVDTAVIHAGGRAVQLGVFADSANAARVADLFQRFGRVEITERSVEGRALHSVRIVLDDAKSGSAAVLAAAEAAGLNGARLTAN
jgi:rare lipoprotein A